MKAFTSHFSTRICLPSKFLITGALVETNTRPVEEYRAMQPWHEPHAKKLTFYIEH